MPDRGGQIQRFLANTDWSDAARATLAGDASNRRYLRLTRADGSTAVLMDAPPERGEDVRPFLRIADHLRSLGLSAPAILARDAGTGLLLLEDLGDALFARVLEDRPDREAQLYTAATELLADLHRHDPPPDLATYGPEVMADRAALALDWYAGGADAATRAAFVEAIASDLSHLATPLDVLVQRDYHAENLLWLPDRAGIARVGLLDFQDAMKGHRAYDLVSLLQDARRDVPRETEQAMIARYLDRTGLDAAGFQAAYHALGAQRNLRILGVFARLGLRDGKPRYLHLMPRVWGYLMRDLAHPDLARMRRLVESALPAPSPRTLTAIQARCAAAPAP